MKATPIPTRSRLAIKAREADRCARCRGQGTDAHHRRSRSVRDEHTHCTCNLVWLCRTCHAWAHKNPTAASEAGFIVSRYNPHPGDVPFLTFGRPTYPACL